MAVTRTNKLASFNVGNLATYDTAVATLTAGKLYTITVLTHRTSGGQTPTSVTHDPVGTPLAFTLEKANTAYASDTLKALTVWRVIPGSTTASALIRIVQPAACSDACWILEEWDGIDTGGTGVVQSVIANGNTTLATATLAAYGDAANAGYLVASIGVVGRTFAPESGWTGNTECNDTERQDLAACVQLPGSDTTPSTTISGAATPWGAIAIEVKAVAAGVANVPPPRRVQQAVNRAGTY